MRTPAQQAADRRRINDIDGMFDRATGWGSWMVMAANEREKLVNRLRGEGIAIEHKHQARTANGERTS